MCACVCVHTAFFDSYGSIDFIMGRCWDLNHALVLIYKIEISFKLLVVKKIIPLNISLSEIKARSTS